MRKIKVDEDTTEIIWKRRNRVKLKWYIFLFILRENRQEIQNQTSLTAAIDGLSNRPSELWETSIPKIIVGVSLIRGRCPECSIANREFIPPSYILQA